MGRFLFLSLLKVRKFTSFLGKIKITGKKNNTTEDEFVRLIMFLEEHHHYLNPRRSFCFLSFNGLISPLKVKGIPGELSLITAIKKLTLSRRFIFFFFSLLLLPLLFRADGFYYILKKSWLSFVFYLSSRQKGNQTYQSRNDARVTAPSPWKNGGFSLPRCCCFLH